MKLNSADLRKRNLSKQEVIDNFKNWFNDFEEDTGETLLQKPKESFLSFLDSNIKETETYCDIGEAFENYEDDFPEAKVVINKKEFDLEGMKLIVSTFDNDMIRIKWDFGLSYIIPEKLIDSAEKDVDPFDLDWDTDAEEEVDRDTILDWFCGEQYVSDFIEDNDGDCSEEDIIKHFKEVEEFLNQNLKENSYRLINEAEPELINISTTDAKKVISKEFDDDTQDNVWFEVYDNGVIVTSNYDSQNSNPTLIVPESVFNKVK